MTPSRPARASATRIVRQVGAAVLLMGAVAPVATGQRAPAPPEATSLLGVPLMALADTAGVLAAADAAVARNPRDIDTLLAAGVAKAGRWHYREAIALYTRAMSVAPADPRPWRYRGHRQISLRNFPAAIADLEHGRALDTLSYDIAYHLGLAYYFSGQFDKAADEYARCMNQATVPALLALDTTARRGFKACTTVATNDEDRVGIAEWRYRALIRAGRKDEAARLLATITPGMQVTMEGAYYLALLVSKGTISESAALDSLASNDLQHVTLMYGIAVRHLVAGDADGARAMFDAGARVGYWPAFGVIGSEVEVARSRRAR
jgi:tetratricopeptide (TPR) repeat protein